MALADDVREFCVVTYVEPARCKGEKVVKIRSGDVHDALNYRNRYPLVCSALGSNRFEQVARVKRTSVEGPVNGVNTLFTFTLT